MVYRHLDSSRHDARRHLHRSCTFETCYDNACHCGARKRPVVAGRLPTPNCICHRCHRCLHAFIGCRKKILDIVWGIDGDGDLGIAVLKTQDEDGTIQEYYHPEDYVRLAFAAEELKDFYTYDKNTRRRTFVHTVSLAVLKNGFIGAIAWTARWRTARPSHLAPHSPLGHSRSVAIRRWTRSAFRGPEIRALSTAQAQTIAHAHPGWGPARRSLRGCALEAVSQPVAAVQASNALAFTRRAIAAEQRVRTALPCARLLC